MRSLSLLMILVAVPSGYADGPENNQLEFAECATTPEEALAELEHAEREAKEEHEKTLAAVQEKLDESRKQYRESVAAAERKAIADLKQLAKQAVANGDVAEASERWEAVLRIDSGDVEAQDCFKTIGRYDVVSKRIRRSQGEATADRLRTVAPGETIVLKKQDLSGRDLLYFYETARWRFEPNGQIRNVESGKVHDHDHFWRIDGQGRLQSRKGDAPQLRELRCVPFSAPGSPQGLS